MRYQSSLGTLIVRNLAPGELAGKTVTPQPAGPDLIFIVDDDTGIYDFAKQSSRDSVPQMLSVPYYQYVQKPVALGTSWEDKSQTVLFAKTVSVQRRCTIDMVDDHATVPAGTFKNCIRVRCAGSTLVPIESRGAAEVSVETYSWYAPGLGRVRWTTREKIITNFSGRGKNSPSSWSRFRGEPICVRLSVPGTCASLGLYPTLLRSPLVRA
jgi:hypothetical protein